MIALRRRLLITSGLFAVLLGGSALADSDGGGWWPRWGMGGGMMGRGWEGDGGMMGYGPDTMMDRVDGRLAFLKTELKITAAQESAWNELATVIRQTSETHNAMMRDMMKEIQDGSFYKKPLPERLQYQESHLAARLEEVKSVHESVDKLYAVLDESQKKSADDIILPMMGMGRGRGMMFGN
jgi:hypothetical protein